MKNKTKTYLLIVLVIGVWGSVGYKIWSGLNPVIPEVKQQDVFVSFNPKINAVIDTFSVQTAERDPFLGTLTKPQVKNTMSLATKQTKTVVWLPISYHGLVKKQGSKQEVFVVNINGKQQLLKLRQSIEGVTLVKGNTKEIIVRYKNQQKTIPVLQ
ncbi:MAG: hypothetical protein L3J83_02700 [Proteobacteria bacterium]|nr:hypothetical protein [Pseudomonadota bacterium]